MHLEFTANEYIHGKELEVLREALAKFDTALLYYNPEYDTVTVSATDAVKGDDSSE